jgi:hypothetical protein
MATKAPLNTGDRVKVVYYDSARGTSLGTFPVVSCRMIFPQPSDGRRWILVYDLDGDHRSAIVGDDGIDMHRTIEPA